MATQAAKQVVLQLCGELLGKSPSRWSAERIEQLAEQVDRIYRSQQQEDWPPAGLRLLDTLPDKAA